MNHILHCCLAWFLFICILPGIVVFFVPLRIYKSLVVLYARIFRRDLRGLLTGYDSIFAIDPFYTKPYAGNGTVLLLDGNISLESIKVCFRNNILSVRDQNGRFQFNKLFQIPKQFFGYFFWVSVPEKLDLDRYIRRVHTFTSGNHEQELHSVLGDMMTSPFPGALWEILVLEKYNRNQTVVVFRLHHVLGDGYTFNHLIDRLIGKESEYIVRKNTRTWWDKINFFCSAPSKMLSLYTEAFTHKDLFTERKVNSTGVLSMTTLPLEPMKNIRRFNKAHFATVGMSLLVGALRRYYVETKREKDIPPWVSVMHSLPKAGHPLRKMVNHWGVGLFKIPMSTTSPIQRLQGAEQHFKQYMHDQYDEFFQSHLPLFSLFPAFLIRLFFKTNFGTGSGFTSVPGYGKQADLCGHRVLTMYKLFGLQWAQTAVAAAVYTHNSNLAFTIFINKDILPNQEAVDQVTKLYLHEEFRALLRECGLRDKENNEIVTIPAHAAVPVKRSLSRTEGFA